MMSTLSAVKAPESRMCWMFRSDPVSRLSTHTTRGPRASSSSQRWDPRKPAPPVTRQVDIAAEYSGSCIRPSAPQDVRVAPAQRDLRRVEVLEQRLRVAARGPEVVPQARDGHLAVVAG